MTRKLTPAELKKLAEKYTWGDGDLIVTPPKAKPAPRVAKRKADLRIVPAPKPNDDD